MKRFLKYLMIGTCLLLFTIFNLEANAVYYAQHSSVVKKEAIPFIILDHLWWYIGEEAVDLKDYSYSINGTASILYRETGQSYVFSEDNGADNDFSLVTVKEETRDKWYLFDDKFQLITIEDDSSGQKLPVTEEEEIYARDALQKVSKDLLDKTTAPLINLQLLYDLLHMIK